MKSETTYFDSSPFSQASREITIGGSISFRCLTLVDPKKTNKFFERITKIHKTTNHVIYEIGYGLKKKSERSHLMQYYVAPAKNSIFALLINTN